MSISKFLNYDNKEVKIDKTYAFKDNMGSSSKADKRYIILHSTANPDTSAKNNANYLYNNWQNAYVTYVVDDEKVYELGEPGYVSYGAGQTANSLAPVQIELCEFSDKTKALKAYKNYVNLAKACAKEYGITQSLDTTSLKGIKTHNWISQKYKETDHTDPLHYLPKIGISYDTFKADIKADLGKFTSATKASDTSVKLPKGFTSEEATFIPNREISIYEKPQLNAKVLKNLAKGEKIKYYGFIKGNLFTWIYVKVGSKFGYLPCREWSGNQSYPFGSFS